MLNLLGVGLGDETALLPAEERDNARGYWEPRWMIELNEEILAVLGTSTFGPFHAESGWERSSALAPLRARAREQLAAHFGDAPAWGWKDPRTSLTLPFWREVVPTPTTYVVCVRSPADAVASALRRGLGDIHRWTYAERWLDYTAHALSSTAADERLLVFYEDVLRDPRAETRRLAAFLGAAPPGEEALAQAAASVDPTLRHHMTSPWDVAIDPGLPIATRGLYLLLRARRSFEEPREELPPRLADALEHLAVELHSEQTTLRTAAADHQRLAEALASAKAQVEQRRDAEARLRAELGARDAAIAACNHAIVDRDRRIAELQQALAERDAHLDAVFASRSWRLTGPLRAGRRRLRREGDRP